MLLILNRVYTGYVLFSNRYVKIIGHPDIMQTQGATSSSADRFNLLDNQRQLCKQMDIFLKYKRAGGAEDRRSIIQLSRLLASCHNPSGVCPFGYSCSCTSSASQMKTPPRLPPSSANWPAPSFCSPQPDGNLILFLVSSHLTSSFKVGIQQILKMIRKGFLFRTKLRASAWLGDWWSLLQQTGQHLHHAAQQP